MDVAKEETIDSAEVHDNGVIVTFADAEGFAFYPAALLRSFFGQAEELHGTTDGCGCRCNLESGGAGEGGSSGQIARVGVVLMFEWKPRPYPLGRIWFGGKPIRRR